MADWPAARPLGVACTGCGHRALAFLSGIDAAVGDLLVLLVAADNAGAAGIAALTGATDSAGNT